MVRLKAIQMNKPIILICIVLWLICLTTIVYADVELEQAIDTGGGDFDGNWWIDTEGGDSDVYINGVKPFGTYVTNNYKEGGGSSGLNMDSVFKNIARVFMKYNYLDKSYEPIPFDDRLSYHQKMFRYVFETVFVRKEEYIYRESVLINQIEQLNLRVMTLESFFNETELCSKGLKVAIKENVTGYSCDNISYYNKHGEFVGIEIINESNTFVFIEEIEKNISITNISLSKYERLCNNLTTNNKYCNVVGKFNQTTEGI